MLSDYLDGKVLLASTMTRSLIYQYDTEWHELPVNHPFGIAVGEPLVMTVEEGYTFYRPDGTKGALYYAERAQAHEAVYDKHGKLWIASPTFSNLCTVDNLGRYEELWRVPGVDASNDTRTYVNGIALQDGEVRYATALGVSNQPDGWRKRASRSNGAIMDVRENRILTEDLFAPHSPRWHDSKLYLCESGEGTLITYNPVKDEKEVVVRLPGFTRGLAFHGNYAFVGQSQGRPTNSTNAANEQMLLAQPGISVIDLTTNTEVHFEPVDTPEFFDIQIHNHLLQ